MFNFSPRRARSALWGRIDIITREIAFQWPHLLNDSCRPDLLPRVQALIADMDALKRALSQEPEDARKLEAR